MTKVPSPSGNAKGSVCHLSEMLEEYYSLRDWNTETGLPNEQKLQYLGLERVFDQLKDAIETGDAQEIRSRLGWTRPYNGEVVDLL